MVTMTELVGTSRRCPSRIAAEALPDDMLLDLSDARALGVTRGQLRNPAFQSVAHGVYGLAKCSDTDDLWFRARAAVKALGPETLIVGTTALRLWGVALPWRLDRDRRIHVAVGRRDHRTIRDGIRVHSMTAIDGVVTMIYRGVRIAAPLEAWALAAKTASVEELVEIGDGLLRYGTALSTVDDAAAFLDLRRRRPGGRYGDGRLRQALGLMRPGTESLPETWLRLRLLEAGYPEPEDNAEVYTPDGRFVGRPDLLWRVPGIRAEYDGQYHNDPDQHAKDTLRDRAFDAIGIPGVVATKKDLRDPSGFLRQFRRVWDRQAAGT
jgi:hypothetical protein